MTYPSDEAGTGVPESICVCSGDIWTGTWEEYGTPIYRQDRDSSRRWGQQFTEEQRDAIAAEIAARYNSFDAMREALKEIAEQDVTEIALDPDWPRRVALATLQLSEPHHD